jgi:hypothetical protein
MVWREPRVADVRATVDATSAKSYTEAVHTAEQLDLPHTLPILPRNSVVQTIRDEWNGLRGAMRDLGGLVPVSYAAKVLGISRQRMYVLLEKEVIRSVQTEYFLYVSADDVAERLRQPKSLGGRPRKNQLTA